MSPEREQTGQRIQVVEFLKESNKIEDVWDQNSLNQAIRAWDFIIEEKQLFITDVLQTHRILMEGKMKHQELGAFRKYPVWIGGREGKPWDVLPELVENWVRSANETVNNLCDDENLIKKQHVDFELIHPFADGNGRMGRILMNWTRSKVGLPILVVREREKSQYYKWFLNN